MNIAAELKNYAEAYKAYRLSKDVPSYNLAVEVEYATADLFNLVKGGREDHAIQIINEEIEYLKKSTK